MRKLYYMLCKLIGYTFLIEHRWDSETFTLEKKYSNISLYKYIGMYDPKYGGMRLKRVWTIKIR
jgi:hypothetical protein